MNIFVAVVEDRQDPLGAGRCRIRIFGKHTDDKSILPTSDLPWALPMQSINSAASSGVGMAPVGPVPGTWVVGIFIDGEDEQQPMMLGTVASSALSTAPVEQPGLTTSDGSVVVDGSGSPIRTDNVPQPTGWELGQTSKKYESGGKGPGTINSYAKSGDLGGASYGTYQFASYLPVVMPSGKARPSPKNSPILKYCGSSKFAGQFAGLEPATAEFDAKWKECASKYAKDFEHDQHQYIEDNYYKVMLGKLKRAGLDLSSFGAGVQDLIWSTAVQFGPARTSIFLTPLKGMTNLDDVTIINKVSDYKIANVDSFFKSSSQNIKNGVRSRYVGEKADLLKLAGGYSSTKKPVTAAAQEVAVKEKDAAASVKSETYSPIEDKTNNESLVKTGGGYTDPDGVYPKKTYTNRSDVNKLATGQIEGTAAEVKTARRAIGMALPNGLSFDQPVNTFNATYPFNKVYESESGHVIEVDDTPGAERINVWHKSGTFMEIDSVGNMVRRSSASSYEIIDRNGYLYVQGKCNISVGGACNLMVAADANIEVSGDANITVGNDVVMQAAGRMTMSAGEAIDLRSKKIYIEADEELHIVGDNKINVTTKVMNLKAEEKINAQTTDLDIKVAGPATVQADKVDVLVGSDMTIQTGGKADFNVGGDLTLDTAAKMSLRAAGDVRMDGATFDWNVGGSNTAGDAEPAIEAEIASSSQAGVLEGRRSYEEKIIKELAPNNRFDRLAMQCETPEESALIGDVIEKRLVDLGVATKAQISAMPLISGLPDISKVLTVPKISIPGLGSLANILTSGSAMKTVTGVLTRVRNLELPTSDMAILQKVLHSGVDISRLGNIPTSVDLGFDLGGIGISKSVQIPGLNPKIIGKLRNLRLSEKEVKILKAIDMLAIEKMDLSSPQGVMNTMRGMTADLMKFGVYNPEFNKAVKVMQNLTHVPAAFRLSPNFLIKDLSTGVKVIGSPLLAQVGLKEPQIAANLMGLAQNVLEPLKKAYPNLQVLSGFRKADGSAYQDKNPHFRGTAANIRLDGATKEEMFEFAQKARTMVPFDQLGLISTSYNSEDWVHISFNSEGSNRGQVYTMHNHKMVGDGLIKLI